MSAKINASNKLKQIEKKKSRSRFVKPAKPPVRGHALQIDRLAARRDRERDAIPSKPAQMPFSRVSDVPLDTDKRKRLLNSLSTFAPPPKLSQLRTLPRESPREASHSPCVSSQPFYLDSMPPSTSRAAQMIYASPKVQLSPEVETNTANAYDTAITDVASASPLLHRSTKKMLSLWSFLPAPKPAKAAKPRESTPISQADPIVYSQDASDGILAPLRSTAVDFTESSPHRQSPQLKESLTDVLKATTLQQFDMGHHDMRKAPEAAQVSANKVADSLLPSFFPSQMRRRLPEISMGSDGTVSPSFYIPLD